MTRLIGDVVVFLGVAGLMALVGTILGRGSPGARGRLLLWGVGLGVLVEATQWLLWGPSCYRSVTTLAAWTTMGIVAEIAARRHQGRTDDANSTPPEP